LNDYFCACLLKRQVQKYVDKMHKKFLLKSMNLNNKSFVIDEMESGKNILSGIRPLIGNTPLLSINYTYKGRTRKIYAKAENLNLSGSIKDRMAYHIIKKAYENGNLRRGDHIVEATSGNTGISFSAIGRALGHKVQIYMPDWLSIERINLIKSLGADIILISREEGGFLKSIELAENMAAERTNVFLPRQFSNSDNVEAHYYGTGPEIFHQLDMRGLIPDAFIAGVGTGGTVMGVGRFLKEKNPAVKIYPLEPANSPTLSTGCKLGKHRIQGISDEFIPPILELNSLNEVIGVDDGDAIIMAQKLSAQLGLGLGISSGANFLGAVIVQNMLGDERIVVTVFPDDNKKYLSTGLLKPEPSRPDFLSAHIELKSFIAHKRSCSVCCDPENCAEVEEFGSCIKTNNHILSAKK
jgi:cysteine synthase